MRQQPQCQPPRPWVDWTARQIHDPIWRLRYLRAVAPPPPPVSRWKSRKTIGLLTFVALALVIAPLSLLKLRAADAASPTVAALPAAPPARQVELAVAPPNADVWQVEKSRDFETYSNGLRVENQYAVSHHPRAYTAFSRADPDGSVGEKRSAPAGIVYHTTESLQAPFESSQNKVLKRVGESLIEYVRRRRCYNFLIDRFGRVFRIVNESDAADHAGHSVWADERNFYINLNDSFIGVSFEAQTEAGQTRISVSDAQIRAAAMLTEMLRSRYKIAGGNCVTHAQVSVNPSNMQIGYHVDWASSFPYERLGLPDNYARPSPAVSLFGFGVDTSFERRAGVRLAAGALGAEREVAERAEASHLSVAAYRKELHKRYLKIMAGHRG
jgi:hypothetical protein